MINRNSLLNKPFLLKPSGKNYLWGGDRLNYDFSKNIDMSPLAETWECSTHPDGPSFVASGEFEGKSLIDVLKEHPQYLGEHPNTDGELPILIKFIDAKKDLSVQVHPNDEYAMKNEGGQMGKTEVWYVLDATEDAKLVYGLKHDANVEDFKKSIYEGTFEKFLQTVSVKKDDLFFIEAGTIHAIGAGTLIAEIQENSNLTYRLYDYNRRDKDGNLRELHVDKALAVADLSAAKEPTQPLRVLRYRPGCATEMLSRCRYFELHRMIINTERSRQLVGYQADRSGFRVLLCFEGCGCINFDNESISFFKGDCIFVPANSVKLKIHGKAQFLDVRG
ncbi:MAG: class I mannose-6-phosphate isomerase [Clostridia bacterium]|nr:class I mannose-6-phosphate isomerase [Clostridia bacterium]